MPRPLILSVIVRTLGDGRLAEALESLAVQESRAFEAVVVDMGKPSAREIIAEFRPRLPGLLHLELADRLNRAAALNHGIERCSGDAIAILDDDNRYLPGHVGNLLDGLEANPDAALVYTGVLLSTLTPEGKWIQEKRIATPFDGQRLLLGNFVYASSLAYPRSLWHEVGGYDPRFPVYEDWEFLIRATRPAPARLIDGCSANPRNFTGDPARARHHDEIADCRRCSTALYWKHRRLYTPDLFLRYDPDGTAFPHIPRHGVRPGNLISLLGWWRHCAAPVHLNRRAKNH